MSPDSRPRNALIVLSLLTLALGAVLQVRWLIVVGGVGLVGWYIDYSLAPTLRRRWNELLDAIRERHQDRARPEDSVELKNEVFTGTIPREGIFAVPRELTPDELEASSKALREREAQRRKTQAEAALGQEHRKHDDEKRQQEAREFLIHESERVRRELEERKAAQKQKCEDEANRSHRIH